MKRIICTKSNTDSFEPSTIYYKMPLDRIKTVLNDDNSNPFITYALDQYGLDALDLDSNLFGSYVDDDVLYVCQTDGTDIKVDGTSIDPEVAMSTLGPDKLLEYIEPATDDIIHRYITPYEFNHYDIDEMAGDLIESGYTFTELLKAAQELPEI